MKSPICGRSVIRHGQPVLLSFDTRAKFGCHGSISVLVERVGETSFLAGLANAQRARRSCVVATNTHRGSYLTIRNCLLSLEDFVQQIDPPIRLLIVGEGPDTGPLRSLAAVLGWECLCGQSAADLPATPDQWTCGGDRHAQLWARFRRAAGAAATGTAVYRLARFAPAAGAIAG